MSPKYLYADVECKRRGAESLQVPWRDAALKYGANTDLALNRNPGDCAVGTGKCEMIMIVQEGHPCDPLGCYKVCGTTVARDRDRFHTQTSAVEFDGT